MLIKNEFGFGLVQMLVVIGVQAVIMAAMVMMINNSQREQKALSDKLDSINTSFLVSNTLSQVSVCNLLLKDKTFSTSNISTVTFDFSELPINAEAGSPSVVRTPASAANDGKVVESIKAFEFAATGAANEFQANFQVMYGAAGLIRAIKPLKIPIVIVTADAAAGTKKILSCRAPASGGGVVIRQVHQTYTAWRWPAGEARCNADEVAVGGGVSCTSGVGWMMIATNIPTADGQAWYGSCDTSQNISAQIDVYVKCALK
jgi:hypothetical protein